MRVGDNLKLIMTNQGGEEVSKRFVVTGISKTAGGQGFDTSVIIHIDSLRSMLDRPDESNSIFVKLNEDQDFRPRPQNHPQNASDRPKTAPRMPKTASIPYPRFARRAPVL